jgi:NAD(P)-dependent dehydrogenase (short-subunit alcohol dehydrogenase family)
MPLADFEQAMELMFWGLLYPTRAVLPHMLERRGGRIVNITSWGGPLPYDCARSAAVGFSEGLRAEVANQGITVMTIAPEAISGAGQIVSAVSRGSSDLNGGTRNGNGAKRDPSTKSALLSALGILGRAAARRYLHAGR